MHLSCFFKGHKWDYDHVEAAIHALAHALKLVRCQRCKRLKGDHK